MGLFSPKKDFSGFAAFGAVVLLIWLGVMVYLWFPNVLPGINTKKNLESGINQSERFQMLRLNTTDMKDVVHVCITSDHHTLGGMITLINSIYSNSKHPVTFHLVTDAQSVEHLRKWISQSKLHDIMYEVQAFPEDWVKGKIKVRGGREELGSPLNYARFYLPRLFPDLNKIVYLDDDCIVQGDIYDLYSMKIKFGHWAAFSEDCVGASKRLTHMKNVYADYIDFKNKHVLRMDMNPTACAFNTGVYVTDLHFWRKYNITEELEKWLELNTKEEIYGNERGGGGSQPPMMIVFYKKFTEIDPSWHVRFLGWTSGSSYTKEFLKQAKLLHWNGRFKPWGRSSQHSDIWDKYYIEDPIDEFRPIRKN